MVIHSFLESHNYHSDFSYFSQDTQKKPAATPNWFINTKHGVL